MSSFPVTRIPGPKQRFPGQLLIRFRRDPLSFVTDVARRHGPVTTWPIGPLRYVLINEPELVRQVLVTKSDAFTKGPALRKARITLGDGLLTSEDPIHARQRRLAQPAFHARRVAAYGDVMVQYTQRLSDRWRDGDVIDIHDQMMRLALQIAAKTMFDADVEHEVEQIGDAMGRSVAMFTRALMPFGELLGKLPLPSNRRFHQSWAQLMSTIDRFIAERRASPDVERNDLLSLLLRATDTEGTGGGMSDQQLRDEAITLFTAGHETTANGLTFAWYLLAAHPQAFDRLREEVNSAVGGRAPRSDDVDRLPWTRAVFSEAMRLYPPAWAIGRQAKQDVQIGEHTLPKGTVVLMSQWVMHRDPRYWPEPERFDPQRWMVEDAQRPRYAYFPFGSGPRSCIGEAFAWLEGVLALATIAQRWRMELVDAERAVRLAPTITLRPRDPLRVRVRQIQSML